MEIISRLFIWSFLIFLCAYLAHISGDTVYKFFSTQIQRANRLQFGGKTTLWKKDFFVALSMYSLSKQKSYFNLDYIQHVSIFTNSQTVKVFPRNVYVIYITFW